MVFDRTAMKTGRRMQDFGLCDLDGNYQNTAKMRAKGFLVVAFLNPDDAVSVRVAKQLQDWTTLGDKVAIAGVTIGEREMAHKLVQTTGITYPILWDFDTYTAPLWAVSAVPTLFVMDTQGTVLGRVVGGDSSELSAAKELLAEAVAKADAAAKAAAEAAAAAGDKNSPQSSVGAKKSRTRNSNAARPPRGDHKEITPI